MRSAEEDNACQGRKYPLWSGSANACFRSEYPNERWFARLALARAEISVWRRHDNELRPHSALDDLMPAAFAAEERQTLQPEKLPLVINA